MTGWTCSVVTRRLARYHDGELTIGQRRGVDAHLATCASCAATLAEFDALGEAVRELVRAAPVPDRDAYRAGVMARYYAELANSWAARFDEWRHDIGLRWAGLSAVGATLACALMLFGIAWLVPLDRDGGFTRMPTPASTHGDLVLTGYAGAWPQRDANDAVPAVLSSTKEEDLVLALAAVVTREGRLRSPELLLANRDDQDVVIRLMNAVQHARFTPARDVNGEPVARYVVWLFAHTTVRAKFHQS